jgi:hypothetical protein
MAAVTEEEANDDPGVLQKGFEFTGHLINAKPVFS